MPTELGSAGIADFRSGDTSVPDQLVIGEQTLNSRTIIVLAGQNLSRGAILGRITASNKHVLSLLASADGSQTPDAILAHDCDATAADKVSMAYFKGGFNQNAVTIGTGHTLQTIREGLRTKGIFLITAQPR